MSLAELMPLYMLSSLQAKSCHRVRGGGLMALGEMKLDESEPIGRWILFSVGSNARLTGICGAVTLIVFLLVGCATVQPPVPTPMAHLAVRNLTDYEWRLSIEAKGGAVAVTRVAARQSVTLDMAGGEYVIEQRALTPAAGPNLARHLPMQLVAGETYDWVLVTLWSELNDTQPGHDGGSAL